MRGQLTRSGYLNQLLSISVLKQFLDSQFLPYTQDYQLFDYADSHLDPLLRGNIKHYITLNQDEEGEDEEIAEEIRFNNQQQIVSKTILTMSGQADTGKLTELKKQYPELNVTMFDMMTRIDTSKSYKYLPLLCKIFGQKLNPKKCWGDDYLNGISDVQSNLINKGISTEGEFQLRIWEFQLRIFKSYDEKEAKLHPAS